MVNSYASGTPMLVQAGAASRPLTRVMLGSGTHSEAWLQALVFEQPQLLPILSLEPAFHDPMPVACEVPCEHGYIDNLYVTPRGDIVLVEAKLWKNPEMRREIVAQVLDYVAALTTMTYETFEAALKKGSPTRVSGSLYNIVRDHPDALSEAAFVDTVSRNLARGRILALAVGDGMRSETQALAALLQSHAGAHFTFALVELGVWQHHATGDYLCVPNTLAQTVMIERGIVTVVNGIAVVKEVPPKIAGTAKPHTITDAMFMEQLATVSPGLPGAIHSFLELVEPLGVVADQKASLTLRADVGAAKPLNLGSIDKTGRFWTDYVYSSFPLPLAQRYIEQLAELSGGRLSAGAMPKLTTNGTSAPPITMLLPEHAEAWSAIINQLLRDMHQHLQADAA